MIVCRQKINAVVLYRSLWACGAILLLIAIPLYRQHAAFYSLVAIGFLLLLLGIAVWIRKQASDYASTVTECKKSDLASRQELSILAAVNNGQKERDDDDHASFLPDVKNTQNTTPPLTVVAEDPLSPKKVIELLSAKEQEGAAASQPLAAASRTSALKKKTSRKKSTNVKLSENSAVKEFSKFEASSAVSEKEIRRVATKKDGKRGNSTALAQTSTVDTPPTPKLVQVTASDNAFSSVFNTPGANQMSQFLYPSVEDIRTERERHTHRPETPEIDRKRRTSMLKEYAMQLGHPRDGSLLPLIRT